MKGRMPREEAVEWATEFLREEIPRAERGDRINGILGLAFPKGVIPEFSDDGRLEKTHTVPDGHEHVQSLLQEATSDASAFSAVLAWASVKLRGTGTIPDRDVLQFVADYLVGNTTPPSAKGRPKSQFSLSLQHACLRLAVSHLEAKGFSATRNDASSHAESACDIVAEAMVNLRFLPQSYDGVRQVLFAGDRVQLMPDD